MDRSLGEKLEQLIERFEETFLKSKNNEGRFKLPIRVRLGDGFEYTFDVSNEDLVGYGSYLEGKGDKKSFKFIKGVTLIEIPYSQVKAIEMDRLTKNVLRSVNKIQDELYDLKDYKLVELNRVDAEVVLNRLEEEIKHYEGVCNNNRLWP